MALLWCDGFDAYGANGSNIEAELPSARYIGLSGLGNATSTTNTRHNIGSSMRLYVMNVRRAFADVAECVVGTAWRFTTDLEDNNTDEIFAIQKDDGLGNLVDMCRVQRNGTGGITVRLQTGNVLVSEPNFTFAGIWHYIEAKYRPRTNTTGYVEIRVDGATVLTFSGITSTDHQTVNALRLTHNSTAESVGPGLTANYTFYDDLYILDTTGSAPTNDFLGDIICYTMRPIADEGTNEFSTVGPGGPDHYTFVDDQFAGEDSNYLTTSSNNKKEYFSIDALPGNVLEVIAVQVSVRARKEAAGRARMKIAAKMGTAETFSNSKVMSATYITHDMIMHQRPGGGGWLPTNVPSLKIGFVSEI